MGLPGFTAEKSIGSPMFSYGNYGVLSSVDKDDIQMMLFGGLGKAFGSLVSRAGSLVGGKAKCMLSCAGNKAFECLPCKLDYGCWETCLGPRAGDCLRECLL